MNKILAVIWWEFSEKVKSKSFITSLFIIPAVIIIFSLSGLQGSSQTNKSIRVIGILNAPANSHLYISDYLSQYVFDEVQPRFLIIKIDSNTDYADSMVISGNIHGYLNITGSSAIDNAVYRGTALPDEDANLLNAAINHAQLMLLLARSGGGAQEAQHYIKMSAVTITAGKGEISPEDFYSSFMSAIVLIMMIMYSGQMLVRNLFEEKSNRLIEILISSCTPGQLLAGKIGGLTLLGLTQIAAWGIIAFLLTGVSNIPTVLISNIYLIIIYFILGFVFYTALFISAGSLVKTEQTAQHITSYLSLLLIFPLFAVLSSLGNPGSPLPIILSYIPFTSPVVMLMRLNIYHVSYIEVIITVIILIASTIITVIFAARLFRNNLLDYNSFFNKS